MSLLNRLFSSTESIAKEIKLNDETILKNWKDYLKTIPKKKLIIEKLDINTSQKDLNELENLLDLELTDVLNEEKKESELILDLEKLEHSQKIKRINRLEQSLGYAETKYEYAYNLLHQLHIILKTEINIILNLLAKSKESERLTYHIKSQFKLELEIIKKIEQLETFQNLFSALVKGEHIIHSMDLKEKKLLKKMQKGMSKIFANELTKGITSEWAITLLNILDDKIHDGMVNSMFESYDYMDFEFVNRREFVDIVREVIQEIRKRKVSEEMINVFVHLFREWYNHERD